MAGFSLATIGVQLVGIGACFLFTFPAAFLIFKLINLTVGLWVSPEEELEGLGMVKHGGRAYPDFEVSSYTTSPGFGGGKGSGRREPAAVVPVPEMGS